jgi:hypothetical protein
MHHIIIYSPSEEAFIKADITNDYIVPERFQDGSCIIIFRHDDSMWRFRLADYIPEVVVFPHHFSSRPLDEKHIKILAHHGVVKGDSMEIALIKADSKFEHFHYHPDKLG